MTTPVNDTVREFITSRYPQAEFADGDDIFALGYVNSLFAMELVRFVERTFALSVPESELRLDNFRSLDSITALVHRGSTTPA